MDDVFGSEGVLSRRLEGFRRRDGQIRMADAVAETFKEGRRLLVEAPTGTGKSLAYLAPAILGPVAEGQRVVISTHTINLQEQLIEKDLPLLAACLPVEFSAQKALGRRNYLGLRRLGVAMAQAPLLADDDPDVRSLKRLAQWSRSTLEGRFVELDPLPAGSVLDDVQSEADNCLGRRCEHYKECFYQSARRRLETADIIVTNHALLVIDAQLKRIDRGVLPDYEVLVVDEAHHLAHVAADHLGLEVDRRQVMRLLSRLFGRGRRPGQIRRLLGEGAASFEERAALLRGRAGAFFDRLDAWRAESGGSNGRVREPQFVEDLIGPGFLDLGRALRGAAEEATRPEAAVELEGWAGRALAVGEATSELLSMEDREAVTWVESEPERGRTRLMARPLDVSEALQEDLFGPRHAVVGTSATLAAGGDESGLVPIRKSLGLGAGGHDLVLPSPFDLERQVRAFVAHGIPEPSEPEHAATLREWIMAAVSHVRGGAFVLFTSYQALDGAWRRLVDPLEAMGLVVLKQSSGVDRAAMLRRFREDGNAVLFGTESFWEGVDVPGSALRLVILTRLPFPVPTTPFNEARSERCRNRGGDPFRDLSLPEAIVRFRQGCGRLIRTESDEGMLLCLDPRMARKGYGARFSRAVAPVAWQRLDSPEFPIEDAGAPS